MRAAPEKELSRHGRFPFGADSIRLIDSGAPSSIAGKKSPAFRGLDFLRTFA
jgi:hypothetical protein